MTETRSDRDIARDLLINWGRWARDDTDRLLGYKRPMANMLYRPIRIEDAPSIPAINEIDARAANAAILHIRLREWPRDEPPPKMFTVYEYIVDRWGKGQRQAQLADRMNCTTRTVRNREARVLDEFWDEYSKIVRFLKKDVA